MMMKAKEYKKLGETLYTGTLPNGLRINVLRKSGFGTAYAVFATHYGGANRRFFFEGEWHDSPAGVAHFLEHKMFDMPEGDNALSVLSANGAQPNAFTSSGMTAYYFECSSGFEENLRMLLRFVSTPYFTEETVQKEQGIIGQEIGMVEDSPGYVIYNRLMRMLYEHNPVRDQVAGSVESIAEITAETLYKCHSTFYAPSNMVLCVAADFEPERVYELAEEILCPESSEIPVSDFGAEESEYPTEQYHEERMELSAPQFLIGAKLKPAPKGEVLLRQKIVAQLALRTLFGSSGEFYNRLYSEGILNRDYDYELDYSSGVATIMFGGESTKPERVLDEIISAVDAVRKNGLEPESFERAKRASFGSRLRALEDFEDSCIGLVMGLFGEYCSLDSFSVLESVSIKECEEFLAAAISPEKLAMSVLLPLGKE